MYKIAFEYIIPVAVKYNLSTKSELRPLIDAFQAGARFMRDEMERGDD